jgi:hypothetical protein
VYTTGSSFGVLEDKRRAFDGDDDIGQRLQELNVFENVVGIELIDRLDARIPENPLNFDQKKRRQHKSFSFLLDELEQLSGGGLWLWRLCERGLWYPA